MGTQPTKYWIGRWRTDSFPFVPSKCPHWSHRRSHLRSLSRLPLHRLIGGEPRQRPASPRLEQEQLVAGLEQALQEAGSEARTVYALLRVELDGIGGVQASFGAVAASRLLRTAGQRVRECLGPNDSMARVGVEEFHVLIACDGDGASAWRVAELVHHLVTAPYTMPDRHIALTASVGVALVRPHHRLAAEVVREAMADARRARDAGATRWARFDAGTREATIEQLRIAAELRNAIAGNEFRMHFQPILRCATGELSSLEALIRWEHPERGCLPPSEFLGELVRADLIDEVGRWTVGEVARQAVEWHAELGIDASITVNVSPHQLADPNFLPHAVSALAAVGASPRSVVFEMTEEIELATGDTPLRALRELREAGFRVWIDDFGTGYSSLSYLQDLPVDGLKIDRALISRIDCNARQRTIVSAIVRLAHELHLDVTAEGVERREQLDTLRTLGCDFVQGHYLSAPLPGAQMRAWLRQ